MTAIKKEPSELARTANFVRFCIFRSAATANPFSLSSKHNQFNCFIVHWTKFWWNKVIERAPIRKWSNHLIFTWRFLIYCQQFLDAVWPKGDYQIDQSVVLQNANENLVRNWISITEISEHRILPKKPSLSTLRLWPLTCSWFSLCGDGLAYPHRN